MGRNIVLWPAQKLNEILVYTGVMSKRLLAALCSISFIPLALLADSVEGNGYQSAGSALWLLALGLGLVGIVIQTRRAGVLPVYAIVVFIPFLNFLLIPLVTFILALLPSKESTPPKTAQSQQKTKNRIKSK